MHVTIAQGYQWGPRDGLSLLAIPRKLPTLILTVKFTETEKAVIEKNKLHEYEYTNNHPIKYLLNEKPVYYGRFESPYQFNLLEAEIREGLKKLKEHLDNFAATPDLKQSKSFEI